jgi:hypothetical protein
MDLFEAIDPDEADRLLAEPDEPTNKLKRTRKDKTQPRTLENWFAQNHFITGTCMNPDCQDPRGPRDRGRNTVAPVPVSSDYSETICRHCFIAGYPNVLDP